MSLVNWDLAPAGATMIISHQEELRWACKDGQWIYSDTSGWKFSAGNPLKLGCWKVLVVRTPHKTIKDVVEWTGSTWPSKDVVGIAYCPISEQFIGYMRNSPIDLGKETIRKIICTRKQFEDYLKKQGGGKWTHITKDEIKCEVLFTEGHESWIKTTWNSEIVPTGSLKPIKPTITKAQAWDLLNNKNGEYYHMFNACEKILEEYEVTDE